MSRLVFPDEGSRLVYVAAGAGQPFLSAAGTDVTIYSDLNGTVLADIQFITATTVTGSVLTTDAYSRLPLFLGPDSTDTLYARVGTGPVAPLYARTDDRIDGKLNSRSTNTDLGPALQLDVRKDGNGTSHNIKSAFNFLQIATDQIDQQLGNVTQPVGAIRSPDSPGIGSKVTGLYIEHSFGGSSARGGRNAFEVCLLLLDGPTNSANADRNYSAMNGQFLALTSDGGTSTVNYKGAGFGGNSVGQLAQSALWFFNITAHEFNVVIDPSASAERAQYLSGIQIAGLVQKRGAVYDCGIALSGLSAAHLGFKVGILIGDMNGGKALASDSTVMQVINHTALTKGFDFANTAFTGSVLQTKNMTLSEVGLALSGGLSLNGGPTTHSMEIGRQDGTASNPYIDFHSSGSALDYDARIIATGGNTGTPGLGNLTFQANGLAFFGGSPVARQAAGTVATDAASTQALANALRTALVNLGLAS